MTDKQHGAKGNVSSHIIRGNEHPRSKSNLLLYIISKEPLSCEMRFHCVEFSKRRSNEISRILNFLVHKHYVNQKHNASLTLKNNSCVLLFALQIRWFSVRTTQVIFAPNSSKVGLSCLVNVMLWSPYSIIAFCNCQRSRGSKHFATWTCCCNRWLPIPNI